MKIRFLCVPFSEDVLPNLAVKLGEDVCGAERRERGVVYQRRVLCTPVAKQEVHPAASHRSLNSKPSSQADAELNESGIRGMGSGSEPSPEVFPITVN